MNNRTKRRNQAGSNLQSISLLSQQLIEQIEQTPQHWSIACTLGVTGDLYITVCQDNPDILRAKFVQATGQTTTILERLEKNGFLTVAHPVRLEHLTLLCPDSVHSYLKGVMQVGLLRRLQCALIVNEYADAKALKSLFRMWHTSQLGH